MPSMNWSTIKKNDVLYEFSGYGSTVEILVLEDAVEIEGGYSFTGQCYNGLTNFSYRDSSYAPKLSRTIDYGGILLKVDGSQEQI